MTVQRIIFWVLRTLVGLALILLLAGGVGYLWLRGSLPATEGQVTIAGLDSPVEVLRDADGIVTIRAETEHDAFLALGYVHAQDRLWQMDFMRRTGAGRLSEVVGGATLRVDRLMRTLGLYRVAEANLAQLSAPTRAALESYTAGVNAFIETHDGPWPPEFYLLRYRPEPWRVTDSMVWGRLMALQLSSNWSDEVRRLRLAKHLEPEQVAFLWPDYPADGPIALAELASLYDGPTHGRLGEILPWDWAPKSASNAWAISGGQTASGKPILANDPHLSLNAPGVWYLVRIETPDFQLVGATAPGAPFLVVGHNGRIAWGLTTTEGDAQDIFIERLTDGDPTRYDTPDGPQPFEIREETIAVRGKDPVLLQVRATRHGPVISDAFAEADGLVGSDYVLALAWPALRDDDRTADALFGINHARNWGEFEAALRHWHSPQQTIVYADTEGTIGLTAPARLPLRKKGDGRSPVAGWSGEYDWAGFIPFEGLPRLRNPARGRIVTANNRLVPDDFPHLITADWRNPFRAARIEEMLDASPKARPEQHRAMQLDIVSLAARRLLPLLLPMVAGDDDSRQAARDLLRDWDFRMDRERPEPLIFYAWLHELTRKILADELGPDFGDFQRSNADLLSRVLTGGRTWCDHVNTERTEDCEGQVAAAFEAAVERLALAFGDDPGAWRWGDVHVARFPHPVLSHIPVLRSVFGFRVETDGGNYTVNRGGALMGGPAETLFTDVHGPGYRAVYDLADLDNSRFMISTGQSGNPLSPLYGSLAERWRDGAFIALDGAPEEAQRLLLTP